MREAKENEGGPEGDFEAIACLAGTDRFVEGFPDLGEGDVGRDLNPGGLQGIDLMGRFDQSRGQEVAAGGQLPVEGIDDDGAVVRGIMAIQGNLEREMRK